MTPARPSDPAPQPGAASFVAASAALRTIDQALRDAQRDRPADPTPPPHDGPHPALATLLLRRQVREQLADWESGLIETAREAGASWADLAEPLGVASRQAAERRYLRLRPGRGRHRGTARPSRPRPTRRRPHRHRLGPQQRRRPAQPRRTDHRTHRPPRHRRPAARRTERGPGPPRRRPPRSPPHRHPPAPATGAPRPRRPHRRDDPPCRPAPRGQQPTAQPALRGLAELSDSRSRTGKETDDARDTRRAPRKPRDGGVPRGRRHAYHHSG